MLLTGDEDVCRKNNLVSRVDVCSPYGGTIECLDLVRDRNFTHLIILEGGRKEGGEGGREGRGGEGGEGGRREGREE